MAHLAVAVVAAGYFLQLDAPVALSGMSLALVALGYGALQVWLWQAPPAATAQTTAEASADHDGLTGLLNPRAFLRTSRYVVELGRRNKMPVVLANVRVQGLGALDRSGEYQSGDLALRQLGAVIQQRLRTTDVAARFPGGQMVLVLADTTTAGAELVGKRLGQEFRAFSEEHGMDLTLDFEMINLGADSDLDEVVAGMTASQPVV